MIDDKNKKAITIAKKGIEINIDYEPIEKYLKKPALWFTEVVTGASVYKEEDRLLTIGQLIQGLIKGDFSREFHYQLNEMRKKGKSKRKFYNTRNGRANFKEVLDYIDNTDNPEEEVFNAMKAIFFNSIDISSTEQDEIRAYYLLQVCKKLKSIDVLVLMAVYKVLKNDDLYKSGKSWETIVAKEINLPVDLVIQSHNKHSDVHNNQPLLYLNDPSEVARGISRIRMRELGVNLAKMISNSRI